MKKCIDNKILIKLNKILEDDKCLFFENMGELHDCRLNKISIDINKKIIVVEIDDLYSNFIGLDEYIECKNINLSINKFHLIKINLTTLENLTIDSMNMHNKHLQILFTNGDVIILKRKGSGDANAITIILSL